jgi:hypothetical protein
MVPLDALPADWAVVETIMPGDLLLVENFSLVGALGGHATLAVSAVDDPVEQVHLAGHHPGLDHNGTGCRTRLAAIQQFIKININLTLMVLFVYY